MKQIRINISEEDYARFEHVALMTSESVPIEFRGIVTPKRIIEQFIADLIASEQSGGSDERRLANEWLDRSSFNF